MTDEDFEYWQNALRTINAHTFFTRSGLDRPFRRWHRKGRPELKPTHLLTQIQESQELQRSLAQERKLLGWKLQDAEAQITALTETREKEADSAWGRLTSTLLRVKALEDEKEGLTAKQDELECQILELTNSLENQFQLIKCYENHFNKLMKRSFFRRCWDVFHPDALKPPPFF